MCKLKLLRDVLRYFHASPATNKHDIERSGFNPNNEYKCKYELEIEQIKHAGDKDLFPKFGHTTKRCPYVSIEEPTKGRVSFNPNPLPN